MPIATLTPYKNVFRKVHTTLPMLMLVCGTLLVGLGKTTEASAENVDFEGTLQQVSVSLGAEAIGTLVGSDDLEEVLAFSPDDVLQAVREGKVEAQSIDRSMLEIKGMTARLQTENEGSYTIIDSEEQVTNTVMPSEQIIIVMDVAALKRDQEVTPEKQKAEKVGERAIRGFDTRGYRFTFFDDNVATVWLSSEFSKEVGPVLETWFDSNPFLGELEIPSGAPVRFVVVDREELGGQSPFFPAYTITEFYDLQPGEVDDARFDMPDSYRRGSMAELMESSID